MRVLVYGASITQGFYDIEGGWVQRLRKHYDELFLKDTSKNQPTIFNLGISGDSTDRLLRRFENETQARKFPHEDFAFIFMIGTNNAWFRGDGRPNSTPEAYRQELRQLIDKARNYSDKIIFLGLLPVEEIKTTPVPWADIHYTNERSWEFEQILREVCRQTGIVHLKLFEAFKTELDRGHDLYTDGLHPNNEGHLLIFERVRPVLDDILGGRLTNTVKTGMV